MDSTVTVYLFHSNVNHRDALVLAPEQLEDIRLALGKATEAPMEANFALVSHYRETTREKISGGRAELFRLAQEIMRMLDGRKRYGQRFLADEDDWRRNYFICCCLRFRKRRAWKMIQELLNVFKNKPMLKQFLFVDGPECRYYGIATDVKYGWLPICACGNGWALIKTKMKLNWIGSYLELAEDL